MSFSASAKAWTAHQAHPLSSGQIEPRRDPDLSGIRTQNNLPRRYGKFRGCRYRHAKRARHGVETEIYSRMSDRRTMARGQITPVRPGRRAARHASESAGWLAYLPGHRQGERARPRPSHVTRLGAGDAVNRSRQQSPELGPGVLDHLCLLGQSLLKEMSRLAPEPDTGQGSSSSRLTTACSRACTSRRARLRRW